MLPGNNGSNKPATYKIMVKLKGKRKKSYFDAIGWDMTFPDFMVIDTSNMRRIYIPKGRLEEVEFPILPAGETDDE